VILKNKKADEEINFSPIIFIVLNLIIFSFLLIFVNNASTDNTIAILREVWPSAELINFDKNHSLGGGFNRSLYYSDSPYVVGLCVDVAMASDFIERAVDVVERYKKIGVLQAKIYRYDWEKNENTNIIDTTGIQIFRSRRITNRGHGEQDTGQYNVAGGIFCYEGAVPLFRREALDDASVLKDKKDDRWENWYEPSVIAYHDRQTTHKLSHSYRDFIRLRRTVPAFKRRLDFENQRLAFIKNDFGVSILMNLPWFLKRELFLFVYFLIWERSTVPAYWHIIKKTPLMLHKRKKIMKRRKISKGELRRWFK